MRWLIRASEHAGDDEKPLFSWFWLMHYWRYRAVHDLHDTPWYKRWSGPAWFHQTLVRFDLGDGIR